MSAQVLIRLAQQQNTSISALMGLRPQGEVMSNNEIMWWHSFKSLAPLTSEMDDLILQATCQSKQRINWFNPLNDPEVMEAEALKLKETNKEAREKLKRERELKNGNHTN